MGRWRRLFPGPGRGELRAPSHGHGANFAPVGRPPAAAAPAALSEVPLAAEPPALAGSSAAAAGERGCQCAPCQPASECPSQPPPAPARYFRQPRARPTARGRPSAESGSADGHPLLLYLVAEAAGGLFHRDSVGPASSQCMSKTYFCNPSMHPLQQLTSFLGGLPNLLVVCSARLCI
jgi:hypothetical protein